MKKKMPSILLTFCFLFSLTFPTLTAHADNEIVYQNLYFVTDTNDLFSYKRDKIEQAMNQTGAASNFQSISLSNSYEDFDTWSNGISNSIVIVDLNSRMPLHNTSPVLPTQHLYSAFSRLKSNNCKIMFISGNSELTYQSSVALLDYVDVHVNVDFIYFLVSAIITKIEINSDSLGFYFITDNNFTVFRDSEKDFTLRWLMPYIEEIYDSAYSDYLLQPKDEDENEKTFLEFLASDYNINFYGQRHGDSDRLFSYKNDEVDVDFASSSDSLFVNNINRAYMIGAINALNSNSRWYSMVNSLCNVFADDRVFTAGFYTSATANSLGFAGGVEYTAIGAGRLMFYEQFTPAEGIYCLREIVSDFLADADMQKYNNLTAGRCEITYMPVTISADGWIPTNLVLDCFQVDS